MSGVDVPSERVAIPPEPVEADPTEPKPVIGKTRRTANPVFEAIGQILFGKMPPDPNACDEDDPIATHFPRAIVCGPISGHLVGVEARDTYARIEGANAPDVSARRTRSIVVTYQSDRIDGSEKIFRASGAAPLGGVVEFSDPNFASVCLAAQIDAERAFAERVTELVAAALSTEGDD